MTNDKEKLFMWLLAIWIFLLVVYLLKSFAHVLLRSLERIYIIKVEFIVIKFKIFFINSLKPIASVMSYLLFLIWKFVLSFFFSFDQSD